MRLGVMCSGEGTNFENIVHSCPKHQVVLMVYNKKHCGAAKRADRLDIPSVRIASKPVSYTHLTLPTSDLV